MNKFLLIVLLTFPAAYYSSAQSDIAFCKAVRHGNYQKVERIIKHETRKYRHGIEYDNGPGSGIQVTHTPGLDSLTAWLQNLPCVKDACWDKCSYKCAIYPGWASIGVLFDQNGQTIAKCFTFQLGSTGTIRIFGWRPHVLPMKDLLLYKRMRDCPGFIEREKKKCRE